MTASPPLIIGLCAKYLILQEWYFADGRYPASHIQNAVEIRVLSFLHLAFELACLTKKSAGCKLTGISEEQEVKKMISRSMCNVALEGRSKLVCFLLALAVSVILPLFSQTFYGSIVGTVTDSSGAILPGAQVTLTNMGTGEHRIAEIDSHGNYQFVNLVPGKYSIDIERAGFKHLTRQNIVVEVQSTVRIDAPLDVGQVTEVLVVKAEAPLLQTENSSVGQVVQSRAVLELPLNGRNVLNLVALVPGVVPQGGAMQNPTGQNLFAPGNFQIGGGTANQSASFFDGAPLNVNYNNLTALVPTQDAVLEFRVQTNNNTAEYGRFTGGVINLTSKSGTNALHGSAYEFLRNRELNANTFLNNSNRVSRPAFTQNQFGATAGGPIVKDKTFFFASYEGFRLRQGQSMLLTVPTAQDRSGDFSNVLNAQGKLTTIYDPLTTTKDPVTGQNVRQPFPGNRIPTGRIDSAAKLLERLWALPNAAGQQFGNVSNFAANASTGGDSDQVNARVDHTFNDMHRLFGRFTRSSMMNLPVDPFQNQTYIGGNPETFATYQTVLGDSYTLSPTTMADLRLAFLRFVYDRTPETHDLDYSTVGFPAAWNSQLPLRSIPIAQVAGMQAVTSGTNIARNNSYSIVASITKIQGRHTLKFGGEARRLDYNFVKVANGGGTFVFDNLFTSVNPLAANSTGYGFASYLLGLGASGNVNIPQMTSSQMFYQGYYAQDSFQVTSKLTVNVGIRWELPGAWTERHGLLSVFQPGLASPLAQATSLPLHGAMALVNSQDRPDSHLTDQHWKLFAPRLGFAYRLSGTTVVRGGYGIFYVPPDVSYFQSAWANGINTYINTWVPTLDGGVTPLNPLSNPFPSGLVQPPGRNSQFQSILAGQALNVPLTQEPFGYTQQYNFTLQHQFVSGIAAEAGFVGLRGVHLPLNSMNINQLPDSALSLGSQLLQQVTNPFYGLITSGSLSGKTIPYGQLLRPYPQYGNLFDVTANRANSTYNSLQAKVEKRFGEGGNLLVAYTWSKLISDTDTINYWLEAGSSPFPQNYNNLRQARSLSGFDAPHRLVLSYVADVPFGKGRRFLSGVTGIVDKLISGWGVNGITTVQSGFPLHFTTSSNTSNSFGGGTSVVDSANYMQPNVAAGCQKSLPGSAQERLRVWFNTSCFSQPAAFTFGTEARVDPSLRAAGINNFDFALFKNTKFAERYTLQFRAEVFNIFNRVQFGPPGAVVGSAQFGVVSSQANTPRLVQGSLRFSF